MSGAVDLPYTNQIVEADARTLLAELPPNSVDCVITSPPYLLQRDYGEEAVAVWDAAPDCDHEWQERELYQDTAIRSQGGAGLNHDDENAEKTRSERWRTDEVCPDCGAWRGQLGHEDTVDAFVAHLVEIFEAVYRVLSESGSLWVNLGDSWADGHRQQLPAKTLRLLPERFAIAMQETEWFPREHYHWTKPSPAPDPAPDRATNAVEPVYRFVKTFEYHDSTPGNATNVLEISPESIPHAHSAVMPRELPRALIERSCPSDGVVLDPFCGAGTVCVAARALGRAYIGCDINTEYVEIARERVSNVQSSLSQFE